MKLSKLFLAISVTLLSTQANAWADLEARIANNGTHAVNVKASPIDASKFAESDALNGNLTFEFRGGCSSNHRLKEFNLLLGTNTYNIPVSGNNRHISGNDGNSWASHTISGSLIPANNTDLINACNSNVSQKTSQGYTLESILGSDFSINDAATGIALKLSYRCEKVASLFDSPPTAYRTQDELRVDATCKATGYTAPVLVSNVQLAIDPIATLGGNCQINLKGALETNVANKTVQFRYEHIDEDFVKKLSSVYSTTTDNQGYANFAHVFDVNNGPGKDKGQVRIIGVSQDFSSSQKSYSIDCHKASPGGLHQATPSTINLTAKALTSSNKAFGDQLCPTQVEFTGTINAGSDFSGQAVFIGENLFDLQAEPFAINKGQSKTVTRIRELTWQSPASTTLTLGGGGSAIPLMQQSVMQGLNIIGENSQTPILSAPRVPFNFSCTKGSVNPGLIGPGEIQILPDHTGGGAPTDLNSTTQTIDRSVVEPKVPTTKNRTPLTTPSSTTKRSSDKTDD